VIRKFLGTTIAIVGGGRTCKAFLEFLTDAAFADQRPDILGVADINQDAVGIDYARSIGIPIFEDYTQLCHLPNLETLLELTNSHAIIETLRRDKPTGVRLIDHFEARAIRDYLQVEKVRIEAYRELAEIKRNPVAVITFVRRLMGRMTAIIERRNKRARDIERELVDKEQALHQIIQGSTIPTFVINQDHIVTHWNRALEKLTGVPAGQVIGTDRQWAPFYETARPAMADIILDQSDAEEIQRLYGDKWRKSALIEDGYEAEGFFPALGEGGKWCWFTAAPIKAPDGRIVGAIETLWDKTDDHRAEEERERYTTELSAMCAVTAALNVPTDLKERIRSAFGELQQLFPADGICIYLLESDGRYELKFSFGVSATACRILPIAGENSAVHHVGRTRRFATFDDLPEGYRDEIRLIEEEQLRSIAYIPISSKENETFGVIRIGSRERRQFSQNLRNVLELIGNRVAVAIENALLQEQSIKSEEKYRSLFNSDPNPIFIINPETFQILDTNQTAQKCYEYGKTELVGRPFFLLGDEDDEVVRISLGGLDKSQSILFSKKRHFTKNRRPLFVNINVSRAEYGGQDVLIATTTDITEAVEKETQLIQAGKMTTLGVMAAGMAHEINQPLNVIQVSADYIVKMLNKGRALDAAELKGVAEDIIAGVERATFVIKHVRDFSRQAEIVRCRVMINDPIQDVFKILGHQLKVHQIDVALDLAPGLPPIMADHNRLEQVFVNLVSNAVDAMDEKARHSEAGAPTKRLSIRSYRDGERVVAEVGDTGIGMPEHVKNKLFEPFFTTKKTGKGTGLGTSISYGIVRDYDGHIEVDTAPGQGTTFRLSFPAISEGASTTP
jgi:PAS domain S-box-containing protein